MRNSLSSRFNLELPSTVIFDYPSVQALATFIASKEGGTQEDGSESEEDFSDEDLDAGPLVDLAEIRYGCLEIYRS